ncbi:MAG: hypothetical protein ABSF45_20220 [Terriglobia bacterium]|jgi:hypothetical protein
MKKILVLTAGLLLAASTAFAQLGTTTVTSNLKVVVGPEAALTIQTAEADFTSPTNFSNYVSTNPTNFTYFVRTTEGSGTGAVTFRVTTDFSGGTGPSVQHPPTAGDALTYTCGAPTAPAAGSATQCSGSQTVAWATDMPVLSFGFGTHSHKAGDGASIASWTLSNDPLYQVGSYTATVTLTISAT